MNRDIALQIVGLEKKIFSKADSWADILLKEVQRQNTVLLYLCSPSDPSRVAAYVIYTASGLAVHVSKVAVDKQHRRQGLASKLVKEAIRTARAERRVLCATLHVDTMNEAAIGLYSSLGFVTDGQLDDYYRADVVAFGSFANGLALHSSDIDVVVLNVMTPQGENGGYSSKQKATVCKHLERIVQRLRRNRGLLDSFIIRGSRIPIIKCITAECVEVDISIGTEAGVVAVATLRSYQEQFTALKPVCLVLKAFLRANGLHEVSHGGLSSFSLANMVIAHLQEERQAGRDDSDQGPMLVGFLRRFGTQFDYFNEAVAVGQGGIVPKYEVPAAATSTKEPGRLCIEDPNTGRDISAGSHNIRAVQAAFAGAADDLEAVLEAPECCPAGLLDVLLPLQQALDRSNPKTKPGPPAALHADDQLRMDHGQEGPLHSGARITQPIRPAVFSHSVAVPMAMRREVQEAMGDNRVAGKDMAGGTRASRRA
ncbi:hypothetical protein WJX72_006173 [[Myrmecia] bisecta]|uniref:N-acetyltransferase domain-containing protein n=1 Tax=[Myrmecia] bisecta TaxID=41462 RepID=A0AAW1R7H1_9CHLO